MVRFKGRQTMKVYVKNKPVKLRFKSYTLCDSSTAYNCNFEMYTGEDLAVSEHGLTHDLVMRLMAPYLNQGYQLFTDNYFTSYVLATSLINNGTELVGTVRANRRGFPDRLKNTKILERHGTSGDMRYERPDDIVFVQWLDKRVVTVLSTMHSATDFVEKTRKRKVNGVLQEITYRKPAAIDQYNCNMGGVDVFDQLALSYWILRRSKKFTKVLFYDLLEIATINAYKLMVAWRHTNPGVIDRPALYSQYDFRENLVRQLARLPLHGRPPFLERVPVGNDFARLHTIHTPDNAGNDGRLLENASPPKEDRILLHQMHQPRRPSCALVHLAKSQVLHAFSLSRV